MKRRPINLHKVLGLVGSIILLTVFVTAVCFSAVAASDWGYSCSYGPPPAEWGTIYPMCSEGKSQSPIDINSCASEIIDLERLYFHYGTPADLVVKNTGHSIQADLSENTYLRIGGKDYWVIQFHWHTPSEHWSDGNQFPMELHIVHKASDGALLVVGALVEEGAENNELQKFWGSLPEEEGETLEVFDFRVSKLLPAAPKHGEFKSYRYEGSLTTPPCTQGVMWVVLAQTVEMSSEQIAHYRDLFFGNEEFPVGTARILQPLNGRILSTDVE